MKISLAKPPNWEELNSFFKLEELGLGTIFTYGDVLFNPSRVQLTDDLLVHEGIHMEQQGHSDTGAKLWWMRFVQDPEFRLDQEARAYGAQYKYLCDHIKDRNAKARQLNQLAGMLSGPMYGSIVGRTEASRLIRMHSLSPIKKVKVEV